MSGRNVENQNNPNSAMELRDKGENQPAGINSAFMAGIRPADAADPLASGNKVNLGAQHQLVIAVLVAAVGTLLGMRYFGAVGTIESKLAKVEYVRDEAQEKRSRDFIRELANLDRGGAAVQVPAEKIRKNPFMLAGPTVPAAQEEKVDESALRAEQLRREQEARLAGLQQEFSTLKLASVMQGKVPLARIGEKNYRKGDTVGENFKIVEIRDREVVLVADDKQYVLRMALEGEEQERGGKKNK